MLKKRVTMLLIITALICINVYAEKTLVFSGSKVPIDQIVNKVLKNVYQRIGISVSTLKLPMERALIMSNDGYVDGELIRIKGIEKKYSNVFVFHLLSCKNLIVIKPAPKKFYSGFIIKPTEFFKMKVS